MNKKENLYYALGHFAYAVALADGSVQNEEQRIVNKIVTDEIRKKNGEINISEIIFNILEKQDQDLDTTFNRGAKEIIASKDLFTSEMKKDFISILYKVAEAFPPLEAAEEKVILRVKALFDSL